MIRVLVVDDSETIRLLLTAMLQSDPSIQVVGTAADGREAVRLAQELRPDLITMDVRMPVMDGLEATRRILEVCPTPIIVVSASVDAPDLKVSFNALKAGALDVVEKPVGQTHKDYEAIRERLITSVKLMSEVKVIRRRSVGSSIGDPPSAVSRSLTGRHTPALVAIGSSTGGPGVLNGLLKALPGDYPVPIVIVQHMTIGFTQGLVDWLRTESRLPLAVIEPGMTVRPARVYIAPDDRHVEFVSRGVLGLSRDPPVSFVRPSATVLFESVARVYGAEAVGVLLTGMGDDGASGLKTIRDRGGVTLAQDAASCVVFGMPKVAIELGAVDHILPPDAITRALVALARPGTGSR